MHTYNIGDYLYALDENRVYQVKQVPNDYYRSYSCTVVCGSHGRGFDPEATHYRPATEKEIKAATKKEKVLKVKKDTEAYSMIYKAFHYHEKWDENKAEIEEFLGFEKNGNLYHSVSSLYINPKMIKEEWKDQFKKNTSPAQAKAKSKINLQWIALCKKLELEVHELRDFQFKYGLYFQAMSLHNFNDEYYVEFKDGLIGGSLFEWAESIDEPEFLRIKASFLENNKEMVNQ